mmetsp:Transcript_1192/g.1892  ORF Transcript_1192/g.1892 Transcript_1192/m.1892 type:complete len:97 (+) Transcript_1192:807-1097(+)
MFKQKLKEAYRERKQKDGEGARGQRQNSVTMNSKRGASGPRAGKEPIVNEERDFYDDDDDLGAPRIDDPGKKKQKPKRRPRNMRDRASDEKWVGNR